MFINRASQNIGLPAPEINLLSYALKIKNRGGEMEALVYIRADPGKSLDVLSAVKKIQGVKEAYATTGRFDVVARIEAADLKTLGDAVVKRIQGVKGVRGTETSMIVA
jgi:DNA-binding Lrp family transcriptional regulator